MAPKHPLDEDLKQYSEDLKAYRESLYPSENIKLTKPQIEQARIKIEISARDAKNKVAAHVDEESSGVHWLEKFDEINATLLLGEKEKRIQAEKRYVAIITWLWAIPGGVLVIVIAAAVIWVCSQLVKVHG